MNIILWFITGAVVGWMFTLILRGGRGKKANPLFYIVLGIVGAVLAGYLLTPMFYADVLARSDFSLPALLFSLGGAVILLVIVHFILRKPTLTDLQLEAKWTQVRSRIHVRWNKLTDEDIETINGDHGRFIKTLQERYGIDSEQAEDDLQGFLRAVA